ncbi:MAG: ribose 5-phosphate isomerase B [Candidatus Krumholzibacteriia bacterium]
MAADTPPPPDAPEMDERALNELAERTRALLARQFGAAALPTPTRPAAPAAACPTRACGDAAVAPPPAAARPAPAVAGPRLAPGADRRIAIGADHGGFALKQQLVELLRELAWEPVDVGTHDAGAVDYPDFAVKVARAVARGEAWRGIMIDGAGIGSAMAANKIAGVRAATVHNETTAVNSREHNDANVLVLGSGQVNRGLARRLVRVWLATDFAGGRHQKRVDKIIALDREKA